MADATEFVHVVSPHKTGHGPASAEYQEPPEMPGGNGRRSYVAQHLEPHEQRELEKLDATRREIWMKTWRILNRARQRARRGGLKRRLKQKDS